MVSSGEQLARSHFRENGHNKLRARAGWTEEVDLPEDPEELTPQVVQPLIQLLTDPVATIDVRSATHP